MRFAVVSAFLPVEEITPIAVAAGTIAWFMSTEADRDEAGVIVEAGRLDVADIRDGDCLDVDGLESDGEVGAFDLRGVPCDDAHNAEVAAVEDLPGESDYPGESEVRRQAAQLCGQHQADLPEGMFVYPLFPTESLWDSDGGRRAICLAVRPDYSDMTGRQLN